MKKIIMGLMVCGIVLTGCGNNDSEKSTSASSSTAKTEETKTTEVTLTLESTIVEADAEGNAVIKGKSVPEANISVGLGILGDNAKADDKGNFELKHELVTQDEETVTINASKDGVEASQEVTVKPSQAMLEQKEKDKDITLISSEPTDEQRSILQDLANQRFNQEYPYKGSKIHSLVGVIQNWTAVDNAWFYKAEATVVNEYNAEQKIVVEFTITPTAPDAGNVEMIAY